MDDKDEQYTTPQSGSPSSMPVIAHPPLGKRPAPDYKDLAALGTTEVVLEWTRNHIKEVEARSDARVKEAGDARLTSKPP